MNIFILHYFDDVNSFNHRLFLKERDFFEQNGFSVAVTELTPDNFNPVSGRENFQVCSNSEFFCQKKEERIASAKRNFHPDIEREIKKLENCDFLLWQFPLRNFSMPAVLKGYVDKTFALGRIYGGINIYENGFFRGKRSLLSIISEDDEDYFRPGGIHGNIREILNPIHRGILQYVGFDVLGDQIFFAPDEKLPQEQEQMIQDFINRLLYISAESPSVINRY